MLILVCNVGSTSLKYKLFNMPSPEILVEAKTERVGREDAIFSYRNNRNGFSDALDSIEQLDAIGFKTVLAKGYYGVHELTDEVIAAMEAYVDVAPAHNPPYIQAIRVFRSILPDRLMVGCFETAFHTTIPLSRRIYALPYEWYEQYGICRLGYHGASHGYIARQIRARAGEHFKLVSCHMGGSGSICAIQDGKSVDTSFGFSLQTGIPHANRSGDIDAYIIPYLLSQGMELDEIMKGIDKKGGLLGISGVSNDLRDIQEAAEAGNERAALAIDAFCESVIRYIGGFFAELGGMDYSRLSCLGVSFDPEANRALRGEGVISAPGSPVTVLVLPTNEEVGIAQTIFEQFA